MHCFFRFIFGEIVSGWKRVFFFGRRPFFSEKKDRESPGLYLIKKFILLINILHFQGNTKG